MAFDQQPNGTTASALIDLGGGVLGSQEKLHFGGAIYDPEAARYNVAAENDWWRTPSGPRPSKVVESVAGYRIDDSSPLRCQPPACGGPESPR